MELVSLFGFENRAFELLFSHEVCSWSVIGESSWATHPTSRRSNRSVPLFFWKPTVDLNRGSWEKLGRRLDSLTPNGRNRRCCRTRPRRGVECSTTRRRALDSRAKATRRSGGTNSVPVCEERGNALALRC